MSGKRSLTAPPGPPRTFDELFAELNLTTAERTALVWHLAAFRARKTVEALLSETKIDPRDYGVRAS